MDTHHAPYKRIWEVKLRESEKKTTRKSKQVPRTTLRTQATPFVFLKEILKNKIKEILKTKNLRNPRVPDASLAGVFLSLPLPRHGSVYRKNKT
jgi:hypothetical protein